MQPVHGDASPYLFHFFTVGSSSFSWISSEKPLDVGCIVFLVLKSGIELSKGQGFDEQMRRVQGMGFSA